MFTVYKPKGERVKAVRVTTENVAELARIFMGRVIEEAVDVAKVSGDDRRAFEDVKVPTGFEYPTFNGVKVVRIGQWIVQRGHEEYRFMEDSDFTSQYEPARVVTPKA